MVQVVSIDTRNTLKLLEIIITFLLSTVFIRKMQDVKSRLNNYS